MALLDNRVKTQNIFVNFNYILQNFIRRLSVIFFILLSLQIIYFSPNPNLDKTTLEVVGNLANFFTNFFKITAQSYNSVINFFDYRHNLQEENIALKLENARLRKIEDRFTIILNENKSLKDYLNFASSLDQKGVPSKFISASASIYKDSAIINSGEINGVEKNYLVINNEGLIGRVDKVSKNYSNVVLITDFTSRIPVISAVSNCQAIIAGNGGSEANLLYLPNNDKLQVGEILLTSGDGKVYPAGIPVARVSKITNEEVYVTPLVKLDKINFVAVIHNN